ncbi:MAG: glycoside hydrolase family 38 C-terminal domain-containing protein [Bacteroidota bacterium]
MKKAYVICDNHMDPLWRRCFRNHFYYHGNVVRPYAQIEEALFERWLAIVSTSDCKYSIEQSLTVKEYLDRNPDRFQLFKQLVQQGKLELLGAGETIIDYNMVNGESIIRNHIYSIMWYQEHFGRIPDVGTATDTFGLSAQIPQIYRQLGYNNLVIYSRVFADAKPFWQGLNGDIIYIKTDYQEIPRVQRFDYRKYRACTVCQGEGCRVCDNTGIDYSFNAGNEDYSLKLSAPAVSVEDCFKNMQQSAAMEFLLQFTAEESLVDDDFIKILQGNGQKYGVTLEFTTYRGLLDKFGRSYLERLDTGHVAAEDIDARREGNTVSTGCYVSRNRLKKINRELEDLLLSSEKFAVFARDYGMTYPGKKIERLWSMMSFLQFHDALTASHVDAAYEELLSTGRDIRLGAGQIYADAMKTLEKSITVPARDGYQAFIQFNPLNWEVNDAILETRVTLDSEQEVTGLMIEDCEGRILDLIALDIVENESNKVLIAKFTGAALPPLGYKVFYYRFTTENATVLRETPADRIENEYYRIVVDGNGIQEVYDKELNEVILRQEAGALVAEEDYGSPWETLTTPYFRENIHRHSKATVKILENSRQKVISIHGSYTNPRRKIDKIDWTQEITLYKGIKKIYFKTEIDWEASNSRIMVSFPLSFQTPDDEAYYEIPYGTLKRKAYRGQYGVHSGGNGDWPALNFVSCYNQARNYSVSLLNKGLIAHRLTKGVLYLSLLRSPEIPVYIFDFEGARDKGRHCFEYCITSARGGLKEGRIVQRGLELNTQFMTYPANPKEGSLASKHSFLKNKSPNVIVSALKKAEKSDRMIIRMYEAYGETVTDALEGLGDRAVMETNLLEETSVAVPAITLKPFEIKTFKV